MSSRARRNSAGRRARVETNLCRPPNQTLIGMGALHRDHQKAREAGKREKAQPGGSFKTLGNDFEALANGQIKGRISERITHWKSPVFATAAIPIAFPAVALTTQS